MRYCLSALVVLLACVGSASAAIPASQRAALEDIHSSTHGSAWADSSGWLGSSGTECQWHGVTCDAGETTVLELRLEDNRLLGPIPASIADLVDLEVLDVSGNQVVGSLSPELGQLTALRELDCGSNELEGVIPAGVGSMTSLEILDLGDNHLVGPLPPELGQLSGLRRLRIQANAIMGEVPATWIGLTGLEADQSDLTWNGLFTENSALRNLLYAAHVPSESSWYNMQIIEPWGLTASDTTGVSTILNWETPWGSFQPDDTVRVVWEVAAAPTPGGPFEVIHSASSAHLRTGGVRAYGFEPGETKYLALRVLFGPSSANRNMLVTEYSPSLEVTATIDSSTFYVGPSGVPGNDCLNPATPCSTIQEAVDLVPEGGRVVVAAGTYDENVDIPKGLELLGAGMESTVVDGGGIGPAIRVVQAGSVFEHIALHDLTATGGHNEKGGGVEIIESWVFLERCKVVGNAADSGGGVYAFFAGLQMKDCRIEENEAALVGGGIYHFGVIDVQGGSISGNTASEGGGMYASSYVILVGVLVSDNTATEAFGGGINIGAELSIITKSSIIGNSAAAGGGVYMEGLGETAFVNVTNTTISGNNGGGIQIWYDTPLTMDGCTVTDNGLPWGYGITSWGETHVRNTVFSDNSPGDCDFSLTSLGGNFDRSVTCGLDAWGDLDTVDPQLGPLEVITAGLMIRQPLPGSPLVDAGNPFVFPSSDQLGTDRPQDGNGDEVALPDIGAVEIFNQALFSDGFETGDTTRWSGTS